MLSILLFILKIIGIILLVILGVIVLLLLIALFTPVRYRASGLAKGEIDTIEANLRISFFLRLISADLIYHNKKIDWKFRIAWKRWNNKQYEKNEVTSKREKETKKEPSCEEEKTMLPSPCVKSITKDNTTKVNTTKEDRTVQDYNKESRERIEKTQPQVEDRKKKEKKTQNKKEKSKFKYTFEKICDNIKLFKDKKEQWEAFVNDSTHRNAFSKVLKECKYLCRILWPEKIHLFAHFGFSDPSVTGQVLAFLAIIYPFIGEKHLHIVPEFEEEVYEGRFYMKGYLQMISFMIIIFRLLLDRNVRATYQKLRNI